MPDSRPPAGPRDPGLQAERTALAWIRTGLAVFVNALVALRTGWVGEHASIVVLGIALLSASAGAAVCGGWRRHRLLNHHASAAPATVIAAAAGVGLMACGVALASVLLEHRSTMADARPGQAFMVFARPKGSWAVSPPDGPIETSVPTARAPAPAFVGSAASTSTRAPSPRSTGLRQRADDWHRGVT